MYKGIFIGYGATDNHIQYIDSIMLREKTASHAVFDEAHYTLNMRPPGPELLYSLRMPKDPESQSSKKKSTVKANQNINVYPELRKSKMHHTRNAINTPLPINEYSIPHQVAAKAEKVDYLWKQEDVHQENQCCAVMKRRQSLGQQKHQAKSLVLDCSLQKNQYN